VNMKKRDFTTEDTESTEEDKDKEKEREDQR
jgi:hypothetical protein